MAGDPEKRFRRIMDKLYQSPKPKSQPLVSGGGASSSQRTRLELSSIGVAESGVMGSKLASGWKEALPQPCRPWDRGDLMRRMASFKARTWFGKPKAVSPVNCARRGWVNVDMDTIACEACGLRLLFSTPSSWTFQQVENAAAVFSLKLDSGHKLLCPWVDNLCDESLASFPPTPAPELIEAYKQRSSALLQLSALPIISESALKHMQCQELDDFLERSSAMACTLDSSAKFIARSSGVGDVMPNSSDFFVKAQKIIALCGWELRLLPYIVGCENFSVHNMAKGSSDCSGQSFREKNDIMIVSTENSMVESLRTKGSDSFYRFDYDPASAALDCKLCGACVGLWAFDTIARPLECFTLVDSPGADDQSEIAIDAASNHAEPTKMDSSNIGRGRSDSILMTNGGNMKLNLSIAGGVPPTSQHNIRPRISLPIISRHLRVQLALASEMKNYVSSDTSISSDTHPLSPKNNRLLLNKDEIESSDIILSAETTSGLKRKRNEVETCFTCQDNSDIPFKVKGDVGSLEISLRTEEAGNIHCEEKTDNQESVHASEIVPVGKGDLPCEGKTENQESVHASEIVPVGKSELSQDSKKIGSAGTEVYLETEEHGRATCTEAHHRDVDPEISSRTEEAGDVHCEGKSDNNQESVDANEIVPVDKSELLVDSMKNGSAENEVHLETEEHGGAICTEAHSRDVDLEISSRTEEAGDVPCDRKADDNQESVHASEVVLMEKSELSGDSIKNGFAGTEVHLETEEHGRAISTESHSRESPNRSSDAKIPGGLEACEDDLMSQLLDISCANNISSGGIATLDGGDPLDDTFFLEQGTTAGGDTVLDRDRSTLNLQNVEVNSSCLNAGQLEKSLNDNDRQHATIQKTGDKLVPAEWGDRAKAFDPLRNHRPFCPWIATEGQSKPGWKLTLFALDREEGSPSPAKEARMRLLSEKGDPIVSVRRLFESPLKRSKNN